MVRGIDSHTGGEPTRVVIEGGPDLKGQTLSEKKADFAARFDSFRQGVVCEPRGSDVLVGALLLPPTNSGSVAGIIFFNNTGYLGMCGHGLIGVVETLRHLGRISPGAHSFDTPAGTVQATLEETGDVSFIGVPSWLETKDLELEVPGVGRVRGDVAYGGNWFYLVREPHYDISLERARELTHITALIREALDASGLKGSDGGAVDHVDLFGPPSRPELNSRNFVLCPGLAYDRSPCGTGTSAKMAMLHARGEWPAGKDYLQESTTGSVFSASIVEELPEGKIRSRIRGRAFVNGESTFIFHPDDPFAWGLTSLAGEV